MTARHRPGFVALLAFGSIGVTILGSIWLVHDRARQVIERFEEEIDLASPERSPDPGRPALFGEPIEGDAWEVYREVLPGWRDLEGSRQVLERNVGYVPADRLLPMLEPAVSRLRTALRMKASQPPGDRIRLADANSAILVLRHAVQSLTEDGHHDDALEWLTILIGLKQDLCRVWGHGAIRPEEGVHLEMALWQAVFKSHRLQAAPLREIAARLEALERTAPSSRDLVEVARRSLRKAHFGVIMQVELQPDWRALWSPTLARARLLNGYEQQFDFLRSVVSLPSSQRVARKRVLNLQDTGYIDAYFPSWGPDVFDQHEHGWSYFQPLRLMVALARFELDRGRPAEHLADLVPDYLPAGAELRRRGKPFRYSPGELVAEDNGLILAQDDVWTIRRASEKN